MEDFYKLTVCDENGNVIDNIFANQKAVNKSIENNSLWILDEVTKRVLPYKNGPKLLSIEKDSSITSEVAYVAKVVNNLSTVINKLSTNDKNELKSIKNDDCAKNIDNNLKNSTKVSNKVKFEESEKMEISVLEKLTKVINKRHVDMPAGSYTTYLFEKGDEKIRKKCGEEAIEVVLAKNNEELVSESADLIYHLMVLLENNNLSMADVLAELDKRDS